MRKLIDRWGLREPIARPGRVGRAAVRDVRRDDRARRARSPAARSPSCRCSTSTVERNAFGRQLDSFEADLAVPILGDRPVHGVFIRAPIIERVGPDVDVLARLDDGRIVAVRERNVLATAFHPELAGETRFHRLWRRWRPSTTSPARAPGGAPIRPGRGRARHGLRDARVSGRSGKVRVARLTDLAALGELSRLCQQRDGRHALARPAGQRAADRHVQPVPPAARRVPAARPAVRLRGGGRPVGPRPGRARDVRATSGRSSSSTRSGMAEAGDIRFRLVQHLLRDGAKRGRDPLPRRLRRRGRQRRAVHAGRLRPLRRGAAPVPAARRDAARAVDRRAGRRRPGSGRPSRSTRWRSPGCTPPPRRSRSSVSRPTGCGDWERQGSGWRVPALEPRPDPPLRRRRGFVAETPRRRQGRAPRLDGVRPGRRRQGGPAALPQDPRPPGRRTSRRSWTTVSA